MSKQYCVIASSNSRFSFLGIAGVLAKPFKNKAAGVAVGTAGVCFLRFLCSFASGIWLWGSYQSSYEWAVGLPVWLYSLIYNGSYMGVELVITTAAAVAFYKASPNLFKRV